MKIAIILSLILSFNLTSFNKDYNIHSENPQVIEGIVTDELGMPLIGANVLVPETTIGTITDIDGTFKLEVPTSTKFLLFSYTGYKTKKVAITPGKMNVTLEEHSQLIDEVVVKSYRTGSVERSNMTLAATYKPLYEDTESYSLPPENIFKAASENPYSTFSLDVDRASYSNVRRFLRNGQLPPRDAIRIEEMINYFDYDYNAPKAKDPINIEAEYFECPWNDEHNLLHVAMSTAPIEVNDLPPANLVFLIDVSGSMNSYNKLPLVKSSLKMLVNNLRSQDKVAIVTYAGQTATALKPTSIEKKSQIIKAIESLGAGGSTAGAEGIKTAYALAKENFNKEGNNRVILATDGDFNVGIRSAEDLERLISKERSSGVYLSVLGFGMGNYKDHQMQSLAQKGNGNHAYIDNIQEARKVLVNEFGSTLFTVAEDVKIQIEFNPAYVQSYRLVGYENRMLKDEDFNNDKVDAGELGAGHQVTAIYEIIPVGSSSSFASSIDPLRFQENLKKSYGTNNNQLVDIKCRYKKPGKLRSHKFNIIVDNEVKDYSKLNDNIRFSLSVAQFGLILSDSQFLLHRDLDSCITNAKNSKGLDKDGLRSEFISLMQSVKDIELVEVDR